MKQGIYDDNCLKNEFSTHNFNMFATGKRFPNLKQDLGIKRESGEIPELSPQL
jgi:hypothetical protein